MGHYYFLKTGVTLACFQRFGTLPLSREELKRSVSGTDKGRASSFSSRLSIESGPAAFPVLRVFKISSTFCEKTGLKYLPSHFH